MSDQEEVLHPLEGALSNRSEKYLKGRRGRLPDGAVAKPNKQKFVPSSPIGGPDPDDFHNARDPNLEIIEEKSEHRFLVYLYAQGLTLKEVFQRLGGSFVDGRPVTGQARYSYGHLSQIKRQPWFRARLVSELKDAGKDVIDALIESEGVETVETLIDLRDNGRSDQVRLAAAKDLLDRLRGKPMQHIKTTHTKTFTDAAEEMEALEKENTRLTQQLTSHKN